MQEDKKIRVTGAQLKELMLQNRMMRELLQEWPARKIMMSYEKDWNMKRKQFLNDHPAVFEQLQEGHETQP